ncbi:2-oxoglutarate/malate carrier protein (macronuclear) [Tetrahymena thermophila SB210]|uniref:2-oxoglutarate/malate carrier protein n=1 Tax=Tetrahymena thermophila (strain SB210) TaxID=312017 RepID=Q22UE2_TETTS|nr:2-oxoglutarate/malate carrier protein [Tetrahymena thermophila SB210]EAR88745.2 2-oxoglutarate/malate carrier protein [Tetrahymena thermophila SB210]|eukprot:XP_001008990.2 2-oxoglutarate/malate carrier protein [Tetrahymena thermophila SB210]
MQSSQIQSGMIFQNAWEKIKPFFIGGFAGCPATIIVQPIDTIKVRIQIINEQIALGKANGLTTNPITISKHVIVNDGFRGLFKGMDAALLRQLTYGSTRLGLFRLLSDTHTERNNRYPTMFEKIMYSSFAGYVACIVGNPADISVVRFQQDSLLPAHKRRNYKNVMDAMVRMVKEEGFFTLWRGSIPTIVRAVFINVSMLTTYDEVKERINAYTGTKDLFTTSCIASFSACLVSSVVSLPFDNIKTKLQGMKANRHGVFPYNNIGDCMVKSIKSEGFFGLWVGMPTFLCRMFPHSIVTLLFQDYLYKCFSKNTMKN